MIAAAAAALGIGLCAGPYLAVSESSRSRPLAPLSDFSALCAAMAGAIAAISAAAQIAFVSASLGRPIWFVLFGPPAIGVVPWAAGELCAGPSPRQDQALVAALVAAYLVSVLTEIANVSLVMQSFATAIAATAAYLCTRGSAP